ncbi:MAG TPA: cytochrome b5-like heme/steroid binding domain-containing protein [Beutenbergiaceae bacterium]|nr:cytochrome b5-like heme/steroid binding domain-containing protein [Beutenbergiaceae bacterium]
MMLRRALTVVVTTAALLLTAGCSDDGTDPAGEEPAGEQTGNSDDGSGVQDAGDAITMAEVEENDSTDSCWTVIEGTVYDVTDWVEQHPGGPDRIEQLCGVDGTDLFTGQHSGQSQPESQLSEFEIGELTG